MALTLREYQAIIRYTPGDLPEELEDRAMLLDAIRYGEVKLNQAIPANHWFINGLRARDEGRTLQL